MKLRTYTSAAILLLSISTLASAQKSKDVKIQSDAPKTEKHANAFVLFGGGYLGVRLEDVSSSTVTELKLPEERGALISEVLDKGPAAEAGLKKNDVVIWWNDTRVESAAQLSRMIRETPPGRSVKLGVIRNGVETKLSAKIQEREIDTAPFNLKLDENSIALNGDTIWKSGDSAGNFMEHFFCSDRPRLGVQIEPLGDQLAKYFGVAGGALVSDVRKDSPAEKAGLLAGDVITAVDGEKVDDSFDLPRIIATKKEGTVDLTVVRNKTEMHVKADLPKAEQSKWWGRHSMPTPPPAPPVPPVPPVPNGEGNIN